MIGSYLIRNRLKLIKVIPNTKIVVKPQNAIDGIYVRRENIVNGELKNIHRARPYLADPYDSYWCKLGKDCPSTETDICPSGECRPYDSYWDGHDIGFPGGTINNVLIFDIDPRNIPNFKDLKTTLRKLQDGYGILPKTWTALTPSGGLHLYYKCDIEFNKDTSITGVDIIGTGFWVKLPPFTNKEGIAYKWKFQPGQVPLAKAPPWLREKIKLSKQEIYKPKEFKQYNYDAAPNETRSRVKKYLDKMPISNFRGGEDAHKDWVAIGRYLCSDENAHLGTKQLFLDWCGSDPKGTLTTAQLSHFQSRTDCHIGKFFVLAKYILGEK